MNITNDETNELLDLAKKLVQKRNIPSSDQDDVVQELYLAGLEDFNELSGRPRSDRMGLARKRMSSRSFDYFKCPVKWGRKIRVGNKYLKCSTMTDTPQKELDDFPDPGLCDSSIASARKRINELTPLQEKALTMYYGKKVSNKLRTTRGLLPPMSVTLLII